MKVRELILRLSAFDPEAEVVLVDSTQDEYPSLKIFQYPRKPFEANPDIVVPDTSVENIMG